MKSVHISKIFIIISGWNLYDRREIYFAFDNYIAFDAYGETKVFFHDLHAYKYDLRTEAGVTNYTYIDKKWMLL